MDQFILVSGLLDAYITEKQNNNLIKSLIAIKQYANKRSKPKQMRKVSNDARTVNPPPTTKYSSVRRRNIRFTTEHNNIQNEEDKQSFNWIEDQNSKTRRVQDAVEVPEEDDEFEDLVLKRLEDIETNISRLKESRKKKKQTQESGSTSEYQNTLSLMEEFPHFQQKYIPLHKINENPTKNVRVNKEKNLSFQNSFSSHKHSHHQSQQDRQQFDLSQLSYKQAVSRSSKDRTMKQYSFSQSRSSRRDFLHHNFGSCCGCPVYVIQSPPMHHNCSCHMMSPEVICQPRKLQKVSKTRRANMSFDPTTLDMKKQRKRTQQIGPFFQD